MLLGEILCSFIIIVFRLLKISPFSQRGTGRSVLILSQFGFSLTTLLPVLASEDDTVMCHHAPLQLKYIVRLNALKHF